MEMKETISLSEADAQRVFGSVDRKITVTIVNAEAFAQKSNGEIAFVNIRENGDFTTDDSSVTFDLRFVRDKLFDLTINQTITELARQKATSTKSRSVVIDAAVELDFSAEVMAFVNTRNQYEEDQRRKKIQSDELNELKTNTIDLLKGRGFTVEGHERITVKFEGYEILSIYKPSIEDLKNKFQTLQIKDAYVSVLASKNLS